MYRLSRACLPGLLVLLATVSSCFADPCGMVPPIYPGPVPLARVGEQMTYVFFKDGIETFVIRPGFTGKVDEFGMLIPFPTPPAIRKVPDHIFPHIAAAIDPPEVVIDMGPRMLRRGAAARAGFGGLEYARKSEDVRVLREEAVGMYEVAVLEAGSAAALKKWMDQHAFRYPNGMDDVCDEYIEADWCFVAVKTQVGQKGGADPRPGQRRTDTRLPAGSTFDGHVQAMGFRFNTDRLVVPMRLSAFNDGELRNIVYLLTDGPRRIRAIPEAYVVRQISGEQLMANVTSPLPLRIVGIPKEDIQKSSFAPWRRPAPPAEYNRDPYPKNGAAKELFAVDLLAVSSGQLSLPHEEAEKELLRIGERLGLRGTDIDRLNAEQVKEEQEHIVENALGNLKQMMLTVVDGDFPRDVVANQNLTFSEFSMPAHKNNSLAYDAVKKGPGEKRDGFLIDELSLSTPKSQRKLPQHWRALVLGVSLGSLLVALRFGPRATATVFIAAAICLVASENVNAQSDSPSSEEQASLDVLIDQLKAINHSAVASDTLVSRATKGSRQLRDEIVSRLGKVAQASDDVNQKGWAIVALSEIAGLDVDELLLGIQADSGESKLVRTWAAAGRIAMCRSLPALLEKSQLIHQFPALGRPISQRMLSQINAKSGNITVADILMTSVQVPQLSQSLAPVILGGGAEPLLEAMTTHADQNVRRQAAAYLGYLFNQGDKTVPALVVQAYKFDVSAEKVPWAGGPLFVPGINWDQENARGLLEHLVAWHLWCERHGLPAEQRQIYNNLRSVTLLSAAGLGSSIPSHTMGMLKAWGGLVGRDRLEQLLETQGVAKELLYVQLLRHVE